MPLPAKAVTGADAPGNDRHAGIGNKRNIFTLLQKIQGMLQFFFFAVVVEADKALGFKPPAGEIQSRPFGVFGKHEGNFF